MDKTEYAYLGSCLMDNDLVGLVPVKPIHFAGEECRKVWTLMLAGTCDPVSVARDIESEAIVSEMISHAYTAAAEKHGRKIIETYRQAAFKTALLAAHRKIETGSSVDSVFSELAEAADQGCESDYKPIMDVMIDVYNDMRTRNEGGSTRRFMPSGYPELDGFIGGLERGSLVVIAARPSQGKSALALGICQNVSVDNKVAFSAIEMDNLSLGYRLLSSASDLDLKTLRTSQSFPSSVWGKSTNGLARIKNINLVVDDNATRTASAVIAQARRQHARAGLDLLVVDYIGILCSEDGNRKQRHLEVGDWVRAFRALAKQLDICVIILSQLNRDAENKTPNLSMLRESGSIEQDADIVIFPYRFKNEKGEDESSLIVAKNRNGPTGAARVSWVGKTASYRNLARGEFDD